MFDVDRFIADCRATLLEPTSPLEIEQVVERAMAHPAHVERALGVPRSGEIVTLHRSPELTILNVVWTPGMAIYPHDHQMWAVIGLYGGREDNSFYRRGPRGLEHAGGKTLETGQTVLLGKLIIHSVANPLRQFTGAIHVYGGDFFAVPRSEWDPETREERPYDVERARRTFEEANERWRAQSAVAGTGA